MNEAGITRGDVIRYSLLPQIFPRLKNLIGSGFAHLPYFIVVVFNTLRIIPNEHPYLRRETHGKYSVVQAMAVAANHITFDRKNIDKVAIFGIILAGLAMLLLQIVLCVVALFAAPAYAYAGPGLGPRTMGAFFDNATPDTDIAFRLLDMVFGIPGIFTGNTETTPFHLGLQALFGFYSYGILLVGVFVIIYLVICIVLETAESGVPFGQRFNKGWAPVRIVLFFGLLLPTPNGINLAQYLLLNAARLGSNVATNAWILFDQTSTAPYIATAEQLIARPAEPDLASLGSFLAIAKTCSWAEGRIEGYDVRPYLIFGTGAANGVDISGGTPAFAEIVQRAAGGTVMIRFGVQDEDLYERDPGAVFPYCGELALSIGDQGEPGAAYLQQAYLETIVCQWNGAAGEGAAACTPFPFEDLARFFVARHSMILPYDPFPDPGAVVGAQPKATLLNNLHETMVASLDEAVRLQREEGDWNNEPAMQLGWGGAGIWFNKIAQQNGALTQAAMNPPGIKLMPSVMEFVKDAKQKQDSRIAQNELYAPTLSSGQPLKFEVPEQREIAVVLNQVYKYWNLENSNISGRNSPDTSHMETTGNIIIDVMNAFMGTRGLFDMCRNADIHPLAQLASMGSAMVEHSIRTFALAAGVGVSGGLMALLDKQNFSQALSSASSFLVSFAAIGLILGFILYYVLPFLPFIYFFFAIMTWVKGIFEAMVGMPLWALAHLRIDGQGMPGDSGSQGYFYILEIFLRPICILIGFLGGILIFAAMVKVLNSVFYLVISNVTGHYVDPNDAAATTGCFTPPGAGAGGGAGGGGGGQLQDSFTRGTIDQFFFTVIYAIIVYMIALPCFKLVDLIPDNIMRWFGSSISTFGAQDGDDVKSLMTYVSAGAGLVGRQLSGGLGNATKAFRT